MLKLFYISDYPRTFIRYFLNMSNIKPKNMKYWTRLVFTQLIVSVCVWHLKNHIYIYIYIYIF